MGAGRDRPSVLRGWVAPRRPQMKRVGMREEERGPKQTVKEPRRDEPPGVRIEVEARKERTNQSLEKGCPVLKSSRSRDASQGLDKQGRRNRQGPCRVDVG